MEFLVCLLLVLIAPCRSYLENCGFCRCKDFNASVLFPEISCNGVCKSYVSRPRCLPLPKNFPGLFLPEFAFHQEINHEQTEITVYLGRYHSRLRRCTFVGRLMEPATPIMMIKGLVTYGKSNEKNADPTFLIHHALNLSNEKTVIYLPEIKEGSLQTYTICYFDPPVVSNRKLLYFLSSKKVWTFYLQHLDVINQENYKPTDPGIFASPEAEPAVGFHLPEKILFRWLPPKKWLGPPQSYSVTCELINVNRTVVQTQVDWHRYGLEFPIGSVVNDSLKCTVAAVTTNRTMGPSSVDVVHTSNGQLLPPSFAMLKYVSLKMPVILGQMAVDLDTGLPAGLFLPSLPTSFYISNKDDSNKHDYSDWSCVDWLLDVKFAAGPASPFPDSEWISGPKKQFYIKRTLKGSGHTETRMNFASLNISQEEVLTVKSLSCNPLQSQIIIHIVSQADSLRKYSLYSFNYSDFRNSDLIQLNIRQCISVELLYNYFTVSLDWTTYHKKQMEVSVMISYVNKTHVTLYRMAMDGFHCVPIDTFRQSSRYRHVWNQVNAWEVNQQGLLMSTLTAKPIGFPGIAIVSSREIKMINHVWEEVEEIPASSTEIGHLSHRGTKSFWKNDFEGGKLIGSSVYTFLIEPFEPTFRNPLPPAFCNTLNSEDAADRSILIQPPDNTGTVRIFMKIPCRLHKMCPSQCIPVRWAVYYKAMSFSEPILKSEMKACAARKISECEDNDLQCSIIESGVTSGHEVAVELLVEPNVEYFVEGVLERQKVKQKTSEFARVVFNRSRSINFTIHTNSTSNYQSIGSNVVLIVVPAVVVFVVVLAALLTVMCCGLNILLRARGIRRIHFSQLNPDFLSSPIGNGHFGEIYQGVYRSKSVAIKRPKQQTSTSSTSKRTDTYKERLFISENMTLFLEEATILGRLKHKHIVRVVGLCTEAKPTLLVMELMDGKSLQQYLLTNGNQAITLVSLVKASVQVASAGAYIHKEGYIHRDLALRNILWNGVDGDQFMVKISDFGLVKDIKSTGVYKPTGHREALPYAHTAPEGLEEFPVFYYKSDIWSYGILLWEIFSKGKHPYGGADNQAIRTSVRTGGRPEMSLLARNTPAQIVDLIYEECLEKKTVLRSSFADLERRLTIIKRKVSPNEMIGSDNSINSTNWGHAIDQQQVLHDAYTD